MSDNRMNAYSIQMWLVPAALVLLTVLLVPWISPSPLGQIIYAAIAYPLLHVANRILLLGTPRRRYRLGLVLAADVLLSAPVVLVWWLLARP